MTRLWQYVARSHRVVMVQRWGKGRYWDDAHFRYLEQFPDLMLFQRVAGLLIALGFLRGDEGAYFETFQWRWKFWADRSMGSLGSVSWSHPVWRKWRRRAVSMRLALIALLLAAPLSAQEQPVDSVSAEAVLNLMIPSGSFTVVGDTTVVENALTLTINLNDLTADQRLQMAQAAGQAVVPSEGFDWFKAGILVIGAGAVLAYYLKGETSYTFTNEVGQTVTVNHPCWPRSYGKDKPPVRCEDE